MSTITMDDDDELNRVIEEQISEWSSNSNECMTIQLVRGDGSTSVSARPEYTHAIYGNEEAIFGYQDLDITLSFRAHDLQPKLSVRYGKKFEEQGDVRASDITLGLSYFMPASTFDGKPLEAPESGFTPPGERIRDYTREGRTFEIWCASVADPSARRMLENMQILAPLYIDGGSVLELDHDWTTQRWKLFLLYEVDHNASGKVSPYSLAGYGTSYRSFTFPERQTAMQIDVFSPSSQTVDEFLPAVDGENNEGSLTKLKSPLDLPSRERLSQFLILPPYQAAGHGQELYNAMYKHLTSPENVRESTVEDPNDAFDDLRDRCDLIYLRANVPEFAALRINTEIPADKMGSESLIPVDLIVPVEVRKRISRDTKIMPRQFDRLVEMHTLSFIPQANRSRIRITRREKTTNPHDKAYFFWRLYVKQRLYVFNRDQLAQVEHVERVEKLEAALDSVMEKYDEIMKAVEAREAANKAAGEEANSSTKMPKRKRRVVEEDEDEDEDGDGEPGAERTGRKKSKL